MATRRTRSSGPVNYVDYAFVNGNARVDDVPAIARFIDSNRDQWVWVASDVYGDGHSFLFRYDSGLGCVVYADINGGNLLEPFVGVDGKHYDLTRSNTAKIVFGLRRLYGRRRIPVTPLIDVDIRLHGMVDTAARQLGKGDCAVYCHLMTNTPY